MTTDFETHFLDLASAVSDLAEGGGVDAISEVVPAAARRLVGSDGATFVLRDGDDCHYVSEDAVSPLWAGERFPMTDCISGWVMKNQEPAVIQNIYADERIPQAAYRPTFVSSLAMMPIRSHEPLGAIGVYWANSHLATLREVALLRALAEAVSVALDERSALVAYPA